MSENNCKLHIAQDRGLSDFSGKFLILQAPLDPDKRTAIIQLVSIATIEIARHRPDEPVIPFASSKAIPQDPQLLRAKPRAQDQLPWPLFHL